MVKLNFEAEVIQSTVLRFYLSEDGFKFDMKEILFKAFELEFLLEDFKGTSLVNAITKWTLEI